jgi:hypothetical protein
MMFLIFPQKYLGYGGLFMIWIIFSGDFRLFKKKKRAKAIFPVGCVQSHF